MSIIIFTFCGATQPYESTLCGQFLARQDSRLCSSAELLILSFGSPYSGECLPTVFGYQRVYYH